MKRLTDKRMNEGGAISAIPKEYKELAISESLSGEQICKGILDIKGILGDKCDLDRLRELVEADRDGRCVVLPQKKVFKITSVAGQYCDLICPIKIDGISQCDCCEYGVESIEECDCRQEHLEEIGKTVFLTREQAETALNKMKEAETE